MVSILAVAAGWAVCQGEPEVAPSIPSASRAAVRPLQALVLTDETVLVGQISRQEAYYEVKTSSGISRVPPSRVWKVCDSLEEAFAYLDRRVRRDNPSELLRLARWCARYGLNAQAQQLAEEVLRLRPQNREAQELAGRRTEHAVAGEPSAAGNQETSALPAKREAPALGPAAVPPPTSGHDYPPEVLRSFVLRAQPILLNSCATAHCHASNRGLAFELQRPPTSGVVSPLISRWNLTQTLRFVDRDDPQQSELLRQAIRPHGGRTKPPLAGKDVPAYQTLEAWVLSVSPPAKPPAPDAPAPRPPSTDGTESPAAAPESARSLDAVEGTGFAAQRPPSETLPATPGEGPATPPQAAPAPDPFDPQPFNDRYHPKRRAPAG
jgi:hypothetical protein